MRENRTYGSEGGGAELKRLSLPLSSYGFGGCWASMGCGSSTESRTSRIRGTRWRTEQSDGRSGPGVPTNRQLAAFDFGIEFRTTLSIAAMIES